MNPDSPRKKPVQKLRSRLRDATAREILLAAEQVLAEEGPDTASMQAIAARAGVAVGTIYNHYQDREGLLRALWHARRQDLHACLEASARASAGQPFRLQLHAFVQGVFALYEGHRSLIKIALEGEHPLPRPSRATADDARPAPEQLRERTEKLVRLGVRDGELRAEHVKIYAAMLAGMMRGVMMHWARDGSAPLSAQTGLLVETFLHGVAAPAHPAPAARR